MINACRKLFGGHFLTLLIALCLYLLDEFSKNI